VVSGYSASNDGDVSGNHGLQDCWVVKLDASGNLEWQKCLGGSDYDYCHTIQQTTDGGFVIAADSYSKDGDVSGNHGWDDYWIAKMDFSGNLEWQESFGGSDFDWPFLISQTNDGGFVVSGASTSTDGDVTGHHASSDGWIFKTAPEIGAGIANTSDAALTFSLFPTPNDGTFTIELQLNNMINASAKITVLDMLGQTLIEETGELEKGKLLKQIQLNEEPEIYIVKVTVNNRVYSAQINLQK